MANAKLSIGDNAPAWTMETDSEGKISSKDLAGKKYILYFYPKDDTPGCTKQACDFRDNIDEISTSGYKIIGVSPDPIQSHEKFRIKYDLNFTLASDPAHTTAEAFGVWREKKNYGKKYIGLVRSTFFVDEKGMLEQVHDNVRATGHVKRLITKFMK